MLLEGRKNTDLQEPIERLEARFAENNRDPAKTLDVLEDSEISFIASEIKRVLSNPRYFLENYFFIRTKHAILRPLWPFWDSQEMFLSVFDRQFSQCRPIRLIVLKSRQLGLTTISVGLMCWLSMLHPMVYALSMSDEDVRVDVNFGMARTAHENLPWWLQPEIRYDVRPQILGFDRARGTKVKGSGLKSLLYFESANQPSGAAYSKSLFGAHLAEVARYRNSHSITEGIFGSLVSYPGSIGIMESTARGRKGTWHRLCRASQQKKLAWEFVFIEWFREPGYTMQVPESFELTGDEVGIRKKVAEQLHYDLTDGQFAWRRDMMSQFEATDGDSEKFHQEFPMTPSEAFISSGLCAFSKKRLNQMLEIFCQIPKWRGSIRLSEKNNKTPMMSKSEDGSFQIWDGPAKGAQYYIGADPGMGIPGADPSCAQVYLIPEDINKPLRQVARWHGYASPNQFARILAAIGYFYHTAEIAAEANTIQTVCSDLVKVLDYPRWYRDMREDRIRNAYLNYIGWWTTWKNKNSLIGRFRCALDEWTVVIRCEEDVDEMLDFAETEEGSQSFAGSEHDDSVMAHMITYYCATQLRPRMSGDIEEKPVPKDQDFINTDYSPIYDRDTVAQDRDGNPDFAML